MAEPVWRKALEGRQQPVDLGGRHDRTAVGDPQRNPAVTVSDPHAHVPVRHIVPDGVLQQVRYEPDEQPAVTGHEGRYERHVEVQLRGDAVGLMLAQRVAHHRGQVDGLAMVDVLLALSEREEGVNQLVLALLLIVIGGAVPEGQAGVRPALTSAR